jgi:hypothetical protein
LGSEDFVESIFGFFFVRLVALEVVGGGNRKVGLCVFLERFDTAEDLHGISDAQVYGVHGHAPLEGRGGNEQRFGDWYRH